jgi:hypothetical protein
LIALALAMYYIFHGGLLAKKVACPWNKMSPLLPVIVPCTFMKLFLGDGEQSVLLKLIFPDVG